MTQNSGAEAGSSATAGGPAAAPGEGQQEPRIVVRDRRRLDPETGDLRHPAADPTSGGAEQKEATMADENTAGDQPYRGRHARFGEGDGTPSATGESAVPGVPGGWPGEDDMPAQRPTSPTSGAASEAAARAAYADNPRATDAPEAAVPADDASAEPGQPGQPVAEKQDEPIEDAPVVDEPADEDQAPANPDAELAAQRLVDLQSLQAEYVNYKRRVDRDRDAAKTAGVQAVVESMIPVLDEIELARQHGDLESGPFVKIAAKLESALEKHGIERYGRPGDTFDPAVHEAIMHTQAELAPGTTETTVVQVMQSGYRIGERVVRAALVAVADPQ